MRKRPTRSRAMKFRHMVVLIGCLLGGPSISLSTSVYAQSLALNPATESPHWPHIKVFDYARSLFLASLSPAEYQWYVSHLDAVEVHGNGPAVRAINPTIGLFSYQFDMSQFQTADFSGLAESGFLHFSEDTSLTFWNLQKTQIVGSKSIKGCPDPPIPACRVQTHLWDNDRYVFDPQSAAFRTWQAAKVLGPLNAYGMSNDTSTIVWLDEHAPGFSWPLSFGYQTVIKSGGGIREFGGRRPWVNGVLDNTFETDYATALNSWLAVLASAAGTANKKLVINANAYSLHPWLLPQVRTVLGMSTESKHRPDGFSGPAEYQQYLNLTNDLTKAGGVIDLHGTWCYTGPGGYTAGNYGTSAARYRMWRLASYYQFKEPVGSAGTVYFNPGFCSNNSANINSAAADQASWLLAYQVDVGQPTGNTLLYQQGTADCAYQILGRQYTKALILVRPQDGSRCTNYGDSSAATVTFADPVQILREDGTVSDLVTTARIRNAEAIIAIQVRADIKPPVAPTLRLMK